jgi:hypothetical protein
MFDPHWPYGHRYVFNHDLIIPVTILPNKLNRTPYIHIAIVHYANGDVVWQVDDNGHSRKTSATPSRCVENTPRPKKKITRYLNVYGSICTGYATERDATAMAGTEALAIAVPVTFEIDDNST